MQSEKVDKEKEKSFDDYIPYLGMIFPWEVDPKMRTLMEHLARQKLSCVSMLPGLKGLGDSYSFLLNAKQQWSASKYMSSALALALFLYFVACSQREDSNVQGLIN